MEQTSAAPLVELEQAAAETLNVVGFKTNQGVEMQAVVLRLTPQSVTFEIYTPMCGLRLSEVLTDFRIQADERVVYVGKATISNIVNAGTVIVCEATLTSSLLDVDLFHLGSPKGVLASGFNAFLNRWQKFYRILPEYKLVVADMQNFLHELRLWLDQIELGIRGLPAGDRLQMERTVVQELVEPTKPAVSAMFERFEAVADTVPEELVPAHRTFCRQQLHPLLLCSPFMHRIFTKPLGYAGDYEMVNMILRDSCEGGSLFAKLLNVQILQQIPATAHRNRVQYLLQKLVEETNRLYQRGSVCRVYNLGCGPAGEVQDFLTHHSLSQNAHFTLVDANDETLQYTGRVMETLKARHSRCTPVKLLRKSVHQLLKMSGKPKVGGEEYDFFYSAGLFDYLSDRVCRTIIRLGYDWLSPGGLLLVTNVEPQNPIRNMMEHVYEWHLIYRDANQLRALASDLPRDAAVSVSAETTSANVILEVRKHL